jgi:hypothetical protein
MGELLHFLEQSLILMETTKVIYSEAKSIGPSSVWNWNFLFSQDAIFWTSPV